MTVGIDIVHKAHLRREAIIILIQAPARRVNFTIREKETRLKMDRLLMDEVIYSAELSETLDNINAAVGITPFVVVPGNHASVAVALGLSHQGIED